METGVTSKIGKNSSNLRSNNFFKPSDSNIDGKNDIWSINQYPRAFCESILKDTLKRLLTHEKT